ncbi:hypothetical protein ACE0DR_29110 [Azotobacter sp. CWF10]
MAPASATSNADPLQLVQQQLDALGIRPAFDANLLFQGGALACLVPRPRSPFRKAAAAGAADLHTPDMAVGIYDALIADHHRQTLTLIALHDAEQRWQWLQARWRCRSSKPCPDQRLAGQYELCGSTPRVSVVQAYIQVWAIAIRLIWRSCFAGQLSRR